MATLEELKAEKARRQSLKPSLESLKAEAKRRGLASGNDPDPVQQAPAPQQQAPQQEQSLLQTTVEAVTGFERTANLPPEVRRLPEMGANMSNVGTGDFKKDLQISAGLLSTFNPKAQIDIIKNAVPEAKIEDFNGTTVIQFPNGKKQILNKPGLSQADFTTGMAEVLSYLPAAKLSSLGRTLMQRVGLASVASGATDLALQGASQSLGSEQPIDKTQTTLAAATGPLGEVVSPALQSGRQAIINRQGARQAPAQAIAEEGVDAAEQTGIGLFPAQITENASDLERQAFVGSLPSGAETSTLAIRRQNEQAANAVENLLSAIAPARTIETGSRRFRTAAQDAMQARRAIRAERASPLYNEAFESGVQVDVNPIFDVIDEKINMFPPNSRTAAQLANVRNLLGGDIAEMTPNARLSVQQLHNAKLDIDDILNGGADTPIGRTARRELRDVQEELLNQLDTQVPAYGQARQAFREASPIVQELEDIGISRIAEMTDLQLKNISKTVFDPANDPSIIRNTRRAIEEVDPEAWNELLRVELERRLGSVKIEVNDAGVLSENIPAQLNNAIFGNTKQRRILFNSVDPASEIGRNLRFLNRALQRASKGRPGGSQTATREEIKRELRGGVVNGIQTFLSNPLRTTINTGDQSLFDRRVANLSRALFDPEWIPEMTRIRQLDPKGPDSARAMLQLLNDIDSGQEQPDNEGN